MCPPACIPFPSVVTVPASCLPTAVPITPSPWRYRGSGWDGYHSGKMGMQGEDGGVNAFTRDGRGLMVSGPSGE